MVILTIKKNICDSRQSHQGLLKYGWEGEESERGRERQCKELHMVPRNSTPQTRRAMVSFIDIPNRNSETGLNTTEARPKYLAVELEIQSVKE